VISRAHVALEALEPQLTRDGCEKLAQAMAGEVSYPGVMIKRSKEEQAQAAELWLALSDPYYLCRGVPVGAPVFRVSSWAPAGPGSRR
jgi:hypothetical protein